MGIRPEGLMTESFTTKPHSLFPDHKQRSDQPFFLISSLTTLSTLPFACFAEGIAKYEDKLYIRSEELRKKQYANN